MRFVVKALTLLLLIAVLMMDGCSRVGLAYRHLDVIIPWSVNDYLGMNSTQKAWLDERLKQQLSWHCTTQLPGYLAWLDRLQQMVETHQFTELELNARTAEARQAITLVTLEVAPTAVELLRKLDDSQVQNMQEAFAKDLREHEDKFVKPPLSKQISDRAKRMERRLVPWVGHLTPAQRQQVLNWSSALGMQNQMWIDNRAHWQALFVAAVQQRHADDFPQRITQLLQERGSFWSPEYRQAYDRREQATTRLMVDLMAKSTQEQRQHLIEKISQVREDFTELSCLKATQQD